jgi:hypothetical protein
MATVIPSPIIEATSLQAVTQLAADPPLDPTERLPPNTPALVLYIARVPGSRDVFLTPIKPREKVVTAEDVQSSLYYLHINGPEDYEDIDEPGPHVERPTSVDTNSAILPPAPPRPAAKKVPPPLPRRRDAQPAAPTLPYPLDDGAMPSIVERPPTPPPHQHLPTDRNHVARKSVQANSANAPYPTNSNGVAIPPLPTRRSIPTPPSSDHDQTAGTLHADNIRLLRQSSMEETHDNPYTRSYSSHPETLRQLDLDSRPEAGTLTLIRRDPGSGEQWNVASILDPAVEEVSSTSLMVPSANRRTKKGGRPVYLDITNTSYARFVSEVVGIQRAETSLSTSSSTSSSENEPPAGDGIFRRRLYMPGSKFSEHGYHRKHSSLSSASGSTMIDTNLLRPSLRSDRHHSVDFASLSSSAMSADRRTKGYTFVSPWNGTCEFTTGTAGRSLKCRHHLPSNAGMAEVSELRFNLPTKSRAPILNSKKSSSFLHRRQDSFDSQADGDWSNPGIVLDENGRISLELGREKAGGGFGGKQAKLGKLIVWPEGAKMLDLLVAANLGLWWRAWERTGG